MRLKAATVLLVALALGLGGALVWQMYKAGKGGFQPPKVKYEPQQADLHPWDTEVPMDQRDPQLAESLLHDGDTALAAGNVDLARTEYGRAFKQDPRADIAVRLGETHFRQGELDEARGWWGRARRDAPNSAAVRDYVNVVMPAE